MPASTESLLARTGKLIDDIHALRRFSGEPGEFWRAYLEATGKLASAREAFLVSQTAPEQPWVTAASWPSGLAPDAALVEPLANAASRAHAETVVVVRPAAGAKGDALVGLRLEAGPGEPPATLVLKLPDAPTDLLESSSLLVRLAADVPAAYLKERALGRASRDVVRFAEALDLMVLMNADSRFYKAAMTLANELASRFTCSRVSLGWLEDGYARLQAMSHVEKFERETSAVQVVEACMEECIDQDEEVLWPSPDGSRTIARAHEEYARHFGPGALLTLPLRIENKVVGSVTCEKAQGAFSATEVAALRLMCDQASRRLSDLKREDRWFIRRWIDTARDALSWILGVDHTWYKVGGVLLAALFWWLATGTLPYRVEGSFILKTDDLVYIPAPFDGYIENVGVTIGDPVKQGVTLLKLDTRDLLLDETAAVAEITRQSREAEKAMAKAALADMKIAQALEAQARARLEKVQYNLQNSTIRAPMDGLIVEGDLKKMLGAPVRRGDILFKIARVERMYAEAGIDERDVHEVRGQATGEIALVSRPNLTFPCVVERLDPVAVQRDGRNEFNVRLRVTGPVESWWRPGMAGVVKIECGRRNVAWILAHRTIDFLRLVLWW